MKASLVDNGFGKGRKCVELLAETHEERAALERLRIGYGALGHTIVVGGTNDAVCVDALMVNAEKTVDGRTVTVSDDWEIPPNVQR